MVAQRTFGFPTLKMSLAAARAREGAQMLWDRLAQANAAYAQTADAIVAATPDSDSGEQAREEFASAIFSVIAAHYVIVPG